MQRPTVRSSSLKALKRTGTPFLSHPSNHGASSQASSQRNPSQNPTSVTASPFGGTAPAGNFSTPPGGTARLAPLLTCLWMSLRGCCFPEPSLPGSPGHRTLSHRTWWRSSIKDALRSTTPPPGQRCLVEVLEFRQYWLSQSWLKRFNLKLGTGSEEMH